MSSPVLVGFWLVKIGIWIFLVWSSRESGLHRRYPVAFTYIYSAILLEFLVYLAGVYGGADSRLYSNVYFVSYVTIFILASWVVLSIYGIFGPIRGWLHLHLVLLPALLVWLSFFDNTPMPTASRVINVAASILFYWGIATLLRMIRHREWELGWNLKMVLLSITLPFGFNSLVVMVSNAGVPLSYAMITWWIKAGALTSWIILAVGMSEYSPPRKSQGPLGSPAAVSPSARKPAGTPIRRWS